VAVTKKIKKSHKKKVFKETWIEAKSPRRANLTLTRQPQFHLPNLYMEEQGDMLMRSSKNLRSLMMSLSMKMLKILQKGLWIGISHQPLMTMSMMIIQLKKPLATD
jgi:hypothetical protein